MKGPIKQGKMIGVQREVRSDPIVVDMRRSGSLGDGDHIAVTHRPGKSNLCWRRADPLGEVRKLMIGKEATLFDRAIDHDGDVPSCQPREKVMFGTAAAEVVQDLVRGAVVAASREQFLHVVRIEIADAPRRILPSAMRRSIASTVSPSGTRPR